MKSINLNLIIVSILVFSGCYGGCYQDSERNAPPVAQHSQNSETINFTTCDEYMKCAKECKVLHLGDRTDSIRKQCVMSQCSLPSSEYMTEADLYAWGHSCAEVSDLNPNVCLQGYGSCMMVEVDQEGTSTGGEEESSSSSESSTG